MNRRNRSPLAAAVAACVLAVTAPALAAEPAPGIPCGLGMVEGGGFIRVAAAATAVPDGHVRVTYLGHSTFHIETPRGATAATDYNGFNVPATPPQIVTMNNSHSSHWTEVVDPRIEHVLKGWGEPGQIKRHHIRQKDLRVYNLPTNINEFAANGTNNNSVFVFEAAGVCLAHLGHLHHFLDAEQVRQLGRIDVLFVPADGSVTISHEEAFHIIGQIRPRLIIPMHYGFSGSGRFIAAAQERYKVKFNDGPSLVLSRSSLPRDTEVLFLAGAP